MYNVLTMNASGLWLIIEEENYYQYSTTKLPVLTESYLERIVPRVLIYQLILIDKNLILFSKHKYKEISQPMLFFPLYCQNSPPSS